MPKAPRPRRRRGLVRALNYLAFLPLASRAPTYGRLLLALARDERVPRSHKAVLGLAAAYVLSPVDLVPEAVPLLGALDDVAVTILAVDLFLERLPEALLDEKLGELGIERAALERDLAQVRRLVPRPVRRIVAQVPVVVEAAATLAQGGVRAVRRTGAGRRLRTWIAAESGAAQLRQARASEGTRRGVGEGPRA